MFRSHGVSQLRDATVRSRAAIRGKISPRCGPGRLAMAIFRPDAFLGGNPRQVLRFMYPKRRLGREKRPSVATYRRHASEMSWLWQDMRAVYPKSPANRLSGIHRAKILPGRGPFRCTDPSNHARSANFAIPGCFIWVLRAGRGARRGGVPAQRMRLARHHPALCEAARYFRGFTSCSFGLSPLTRTMLLFAAPAFA